jgi:hypothetical protein
MIPKIGSGSSAFGHENKGDSMTKSDRQAADYRAEASERAAPNGLRTERVVLEVTYDQEKQGHPGTWDWSTMVLDEGESVRVVEEDREAADRVSREEGYRVLLSEIIAAREERDAANREREELNQQAKKALAHSDKMWLACLAVGGERDKLQARGSELESQLESVADRAAAAETALESAPAATGGGEGEPYMVTASGIPLYRQPPQPRGWLTGEERDFLENHRHQCAERASTFSNARSLSWVRRVKLIDAILARSSPPEVVRPKRWDDMRSVIGDQRDADWLAALATAGVSWKETT